MIVIIITIVTGNQYASHPPILTKICFFDGFLSLSVLFSKILTLSVASRTTLMTADSECSAVQLADVTEFLNLEKIIKFYEF